MDEDQETYLTGEDANFQVFTSDGQAFGLSVSRPKTLEAAEAYVKRWFKHRHPNLEIAEIKLLSSTTDQD